MHDIPFVFGYSSEEIWETFSFLQWSIPQLEFEDFLWMWARNKDKERACLFSEATGQCVLIPPKMGLLCGDPFIC